MTIVNDVARAGVNSPALAVSRADKPVLRLTLHPNRSMGRTGVTWLFGLVAFGLAMALLPFLGTRIGWALLPFLLAPMVLLYGFLRLNYRDGRKSETLCLWPDLITVTRRDPSGNELFWQAHPFWVQLKIQPQGRPENYLTLKGNGREIELGSFLSPEERLELRSEIETAIRNLRR